MMMMRKKAHNKQHMMGIERQELYTASKALESQASQTRCSWTTICLISLHLSLTVLCPLLYSYPCLIILWLASFVRTACWSHDDSFDVDTPYPCALLPDALSIFVFMFWFSNCGRFKRGVALRQYHEWKWLCPFMGTCLYVWLALYVCFDIPFTFPHLDMCVWLSLLHLLTSLPMPSFLWTYDSHNTKASTPHNR